VKNKLIFIIVALACLIPTVVAISSYNAVQKAPINEKTAVSIVIEDINDKKYTLTKEEDGDDADVMIKFFMKLVKHADAIVALPDSLTGQKYFKVEIASNIRSESYRFYFSTDPSTNYFLSPSGQTYKIDKEDAELFITSKYAESLYKTSSMPKMTLLGKHEVTPDSADWQYKNYTGSFVVADTEGMVKPEAESYDLEGGLAIDFDTAPDYCVVSITDASGNIVFNDSLAALASFSFGSNTQTYTISIDAKWYEDETRSYRGELVYSFSALVTGPAEFYLGMDTVKSGRFTAITALNVAKPENITFSSDLPISIAPVFYPAGENTAVGFLPIDMSTPSGVYTLSFTYGETTREMLISITYDGGKVSYYTVPEDVVASCRTETALTAFDQAVAQITAKGSNTRYFAGHFDEGLEGVGVSAIIQRGFGRDIYLNGGTSPTYINNGVDYSVAEGADVTACNAGEVVYSGSLTYAGNIVVIEHGWGLKTWYYNLGTVNVAEGTKVERGTKIGTTGKTGFTGQTGAHIAMSVGSTFVSPYDTWADSQVAGKVVIAKIDE